MDWFPSLKRDLPDEQPLVVMEVVQTVPKTNLTVGDKQSTAKQEQIPTKRPKPPPKPTPASEPPKPKPAKLAAKAPEAKVEVLPPKVADQPKAKPPLPNRPCRPN